ncbi:MAG: phosphotransferase [Candidatus Taylorbacteria bacterium]
MELSQNELRLKIQELLGNEVAVFILKGTGSCNNAYSVETRDGHKYIVKQEREKREVQPQNSLPIEAGVARKLFDLNLSLPTPHVVFVSENPLMYGYEYLEGDLMIDVWKSLSEEERFSICATLGNFHAEIGKKVNKDEAKSLRIKIDESPSLHPEVEKEYNTILSSIDVPDELKNLAKHARAIFDQTFDKTVFQFIHNDSHHENIIIKNKKISGVIDFGNAEYGEMAKEFSRYIRDYPSYFEYIVSSYEEKSGNILSRGRLICNAFLSGLMEIVEAFRKGGGERVKAHESIAIYKEKIESLKFGTSTIYSKKS